MNCTVRVRDRSEKPLLTIPYKAVNEQMGEYFVFVVGDSSKVQERRIRLGRQVGDQTVVQEGLETGRTHRGNRTTEAQGRRAGGGEGESRRRNNFFGKCECFGGGRAIDNRVRNRTRNVIDHAA